MPGSPHEHHERRSRGRRPRAPDPRRFLLAAVQPAPTNRRRLRRRWPAQRPSRSPVARRTPSEAARRRVRSEGPVDARAPRRWWHRRRPNRADTARTGARPRPRPRRSSRRARTRRRPVDKPTRSGIPSAAAASCTADPARTRWSADGSRASAPSPVLFTTRPPNTVTTLATMAVVAVALGLRGVGADAREGARRADGVGEQHVRRFEHRTPFGGWRDSCGF